MVVLLLLGVEIEAVEGLGRWGKWGRREGGYGIEEACLGVREGKEGAVKAQVGGI